MFKLSFIVAIFLADFLPRLSTGEEVVPVQFSVGDLRNCPSFSLENDSTSLHAMDSLPGMGFDVLRDIDMGQILNYNYSLCQISKDGKYILPDGFYLVPTKMSVIEEFAEYFDHWDQYTSLTSSSISAHASAAFDYATIQASFSSEHSEMKSHMVNEDSSAARIHLRSKVYTIHAQPRMPLSPDFKSRLFEIAAYMEKNTSSIDYVHYLTELLVRDYGTHYLTSVDVGAIIGQTDFVSNNYTRNQSSDHTSVKAAVSASFFSKVSVGSGYGWSSNHSLDSGYMNNRTYSKTYTIGGLPYRPNLTFDQWTDSISDNLVIIDRAGAPLHFIVNSYTVPELRHETRAALADVIYEAVTRYFKVNTRKGCTNPASKNFDFQANVDDGTCDPQIIPTNYTFGGAFQTCTAPNADRDCNLVDQQNPLTEEFSCIADGYIPVKFFNGTVDVRYWKHIFFFVKTGTQTYDYEATWCFPDPRLNIPADSGFLFGGFYSTSTPNLLTNTMGCPQYFIPLKIGNYLSVCVSTDYEHGFRYAIPFGGFETCQTGNPQAAGTYTDDTTLWPHECPQGYTRYFGAVEHGCEINLCIPTGAYKSTSYSRLLSPRLPPYHAHVPLELNDTEVFSFLGSDGNEWRRNWSGEWSTAESSSQCYATPSTTEQESIHTTSDKTTYTSPMSQSETNTLLKRGPPRRWR